MTAPSRPAPAPRPVLVWIHGGGFTFGSGSDYDAAPLSTRGDLVVVTINYRLGVFGGLSTAEPGTRNIQLQDQLAALRWVQANAAAFGGDPAQVTLAGESAGAFSTCSLLASPRARGLFSRAIIASGSCRTRHPAGALAAELPAVSTWNPQAATDRYSRDAVADLGCPDPATQPACLRARPVRDLVAAGGSFTSLVYGSGILPDDPGRTPRANWATTVPVLSGNTSDEHLGTVLSAYLGADPGTTGPR